jgi:hypothetical protein
MTVKQETYSSTELSIITVGVGAVVLLPVLIKHPTVPKRVLRRPSVCCSQALFFPSRTSEA